jgi:alpha-tubulin suppressor-like RCC1 family protein
MCQDANNNVFGWGDNYAGQLGTGDDIHRDDPTLMKSLAEVAVTQFSCGFQHACFVSAEGHVYGVGKNNRFQMGKY